MPQIRSNVRRENNAQSNRSRNDVAERQTERAEQYRGRNYRRTWGRKKVSGRSVNQLHNLLQSKSEAIDYEYAEMFETQDPVVRKLLRQIAKEEQNHELKIAKIIDYLERNPEAGSISKLIKQLELMLGSNRGKGFTTGVITTLVGLAFLPTAQKALKPLLLSVVKGVNDISEKAKDALAVVKESVEDVVAEAQFERLKDTIDKEIIGVTPEK